MGLSVLLTLLTLVGTAASTAGLGGAIRVESAQATVEKAAAPTARPAWEHMPGVAATFAKGSYRPAETARLVLWRREPGFSVRIYRAGPVKGVPPMVSNTYMHGRPVTGTFRFGPTNAHGEVALRIGQWPSGLYFARITTRRDRVGFAPFIVRPEKLGTRAVLVVLPTYTWQAYNFRDDDRDGTGDTWYSGTRRRTVQLVRPHLARGVPYNFRNYDYPFLQWLDGTGKSVDFIGDDDLDAVENAKALARAYRLIVFPGHHEYVTEREYDLIERYRDLGGHLMFLSANNFFWKVERKGDTIVRIDRWRDLGRPEAALVGVQYLSSGGGAQKAPFIVTNTLRHPWLFGNTRLRVGDRFGHSGIEIDHTTPSSPRGIQIVAHIPDLIGPGGTAQMTYYETPAGARVFAAGAFTLGGARNPVSRQILQNLWRRLAGGGAGTCPNPAARPPRSIRVSGTTEPGRPPA